MKNVLAIVTVLFGANAMATSVMMPRPVTPNLYNCEGAGNTAIHYSTSSFVGSPQMSVTFLGDEANVSGAEIKTARTLIGTLVTVSDMSKVPVDGPEYRYSVVLPNIRLRNGATEKFSTIAVKTVIANPFFRPTPGSSTVENNEFVNVECTAQQVFFFSAAN